MYKILLISLYILFHENRLLRLNKISIFSVEKKMEKFDI